MDLHFLRNAQVGSQRAGARPGQAFQRALRQRGEPFVALCRQQLDYAKYEALARFLEAQRPQLLINAAGYTGKPNVDACETARADTLQGNTLFPAMVSHACAASGTPWGHVSSGCIYSGAIVADGGLRRIEPDLNQPPWKDRIARDPSIVQGFREEDEPNFSFRRPPCKLLQRHESARRRSAGRRPAGLSLAVAHSLQRARPFAQLSIQAAALSEVYDNVNSISHLDDFARASLDLWKTRAPFGTYNITNPGFVTTRQVIEMIERILKPARTFEFWQSDDEFYRAAAKAPRSNCVLDASKLLAAGINIRGVAEALADALARWQPESPST